MSSLTIDGKTSRAVKGRSLFDHASDLGARIPSSCLGDGSCRECLVEVLAGGDMLTPPTEEESFLTGNYRLACQAVVDGQAEDLTINVLKRQRQIVAEGTPSRDLELDPPLRREGDQVVRGDDRLAETTGRLLGIAADIGTTTVALCLMDLETGAHVCTASFENPQTFGGSDVVHRIHYESEHPGELQRVLIAFLNREIEQMPCDRDEIYELVVVGNTTMRDLLAGLDVQSIGQRPFKSTTEHAVDDGRADTTALALPAAELGLAVHAAAQVYFAPLISCHVGADAAACVLASRLHEAEAPFMIMDIGTNTEVVLGNRNRMVCASCAAGPAFEGGRIKYGMPGIEGAIESVVLRNSHVEVRTIGDVEPRGICGSGLIDLVAELTRHGHLTSTGRFAGETKEFLAHAASGITLSEPDVQELAQSKGATFAGTAIVLKQYPLPLEELTALHLAGGFAHYINTDNSRLIGLTPAIPEERLRKVGNLAAEGAKELLLSVRKRRDLEAAVRRIEHLELETDPEFFTLFVEGCLFGDG